MGDKGGKKDKDKRTRNKFLRNTSRRTKKQRISNRKRPHSRDGRNGDVFSMLTCNDPPDTRKHVQLSAHL